MCSSSSSSIGCCRAGLRLQLLQLLHEIQTKWWRALAASHAPLPPSSPLYAFLYLSVLRQLLMWPNKKLNVLASLAHPTWRQAIAAHSYYSLFFLFLFPSSYPFFAHYQLHYVALATRQTAAQPAQRSPSSSSALAASCNSFMCQKLHAIYLWSLTHTHICTHLQHTHPHAHTCKGALDSFN